MALQNCSNTISLRCCSNNAIIITPCVPTIDGTPFSNFTLGNVYFDSNNVCWEAVDSTSNAYNTTNDYFTSTDCIDCQSSHGGNCDETTNTPPGECTCLLITVTALDIANSNGNVITPNGSVLVDAANCINGSGTTYVFTSPGTYTVCAQGISQPYYFQTDIKQLGGTSTSSQTASACSTDDDCIVPTPTPTPTNTPTGTNTPTPTPTNTNTPTNTGTPTSTPNVTPSNTGTPVPTPEVTPSHTPTNTPTPTEGCKCIQVDTIIPFYATGNTSNPNNLIEIDYYNCDNNLVTFSATTAIASAVFYLCTHDGVVEEVRAWQDDVLYSADTFNFPPYDPNGWKPSMTYDGGIPYMNYGSFGSCAGDPCGTTPTPTPTQTSTPNVTPTPSSTSNVTPTPTNTSTSNVTPTPTSSPGSTPAVTPTQTPTGTPTPTSSANVTPTPTNTSTSNVTPTPTSSPGSTPAVTPTQTPTSTSNVTPTPTSSPGSTPAVTPTQTPTGTPQVTTTPTSTSNVTPTPTNTSTPNVTQTPTSTSSVTPTPTNTGTPNTTPTPSVTSSQTPTPTPTSTSNVTPTPSSTASVTPTPSVTSSQTPTPTQTSTPNVTPTPSPTAAPVGSCSGDYCVNINIDAYSGYNGTYNYYQDFNGKPSWTGGTVPGYIFYKTGTTASTGWCLSDSYTGTCIASGPISPFCDDDCPDFDNTVIYSGSCTGSTTPNPCSGLTFDAEFYCDFSTGATPTPTASSVIPSSTPTPTPTNPTCASFGANITVTDLTPTPTPSSTPTPTPTLVRSVNTGGTVNYVIDSGGFVCFDVKELKDCDSGILYYVAENIEYTGSTVSTGTTMQVYLNGNLRCMTYQRDVNGSATAYLGEVVEVYPSGCVSCALTPTPTPTQTLTPTPSITPSATPIATVAPTSNYVFSSCTTNKVIIQTVPPGSMSNNGVVSISGVCYTYLGKFTNYIPPVGVQSVNINALTTTPSTIYDNCTTCNTPVTTYYQVVKMDVACRESSVTYLVNLGTGVSAPSVGQYVKLQNTTSVAYQGCFKVTGTTTTGPSTNTIIKVYNQCDCPDIS